MAETNNTTTLNKPVDFDNSNFFHDDKTPNNDDDDDDWLEEETCQYEVNTPEFEENAHNDDDDDDDDYDDDDYPPSPTCSDSNEAICSHAIDFTLHTIVEESYEDSELEFSSNKFDKKNSDDNNVSPMDIERYFFFGLENQNQDAANKNYLDDSSSDIYSDLSDSGTNNQYDETQSASLSTSRLEKYFLSEFMGFSLENKSDCSVGSDSEKQESPSQRKKKLRARRTTRSNSSSLDNLLVEVGEQSNESEDSSESDIDKLPSEAITSDKLDASFVKRKKNYRKRETFVDSITSSSSAVPFESKRDKHSLPIPTTKRNQSTIHKPTIDPPLIEKEHTTKPIEKQSIESLKTSQHTDATDSFNNWSSDEETNIMMSKMRQFFKTLIAVKTNNITPNNYLIPNDNHQALVRKTDAIRFPYVENELIRLMKTVPGINNQQLKEIVEYLSSEDTWSDSNDSSDFNTQASSKMDKQNQELSTKSISRRCEKIQTNTAPDQRKNENSLCILESDTTMMYTNLFESFIMNNSTSKLSPKVLVIDNNVQRISKSAETEQLLDNIWQHIGQKLVNLMREDIPHCMVLPDTEIKTKSTPPCIKEDETRTKKPNNNSGESLLPVVVENENDEETCLTRSKSHDKLIGTTGMATSSNRSWHSYSNTAVNDTVGEASDCDRFSWRGSFESALLAPTTCSKNKLLTGSEENGSRMSQWSLSKRGSVDNLWCTNVQNIKSLDRVQSCGSILGKDAVQCFEDETSNEKKVFEKTLHENMQANSLQSIQGVESSANTSEMEPILNSTQSSSIKSARYRSPVMQSNINSISFRKNTKETKLSAGTKPAASGLQKNTITSTSLGDFSMTELCGEIDDSPILQKKSFYKRKSFNLRGRSESLTSVYSESLYDNIKVRGQVEFGVQYNYKINALEIHIVQCKDLPSVSSIKCKSNPYVKVYLLPDLSKAGKRKTRVKKQTVNPVYDETLRFYMPISKIKKHSIWLTVWNSDLLGRNDFLGEVILDLENKVFDKPQSQWYKLQQKSEIAEESFQHRGDLIVALKFIPGGKTKDLDSSAKGKLHVLVKEAKYLYSNRTSGTCDTFCKSYLLPIRTKSSKQKTHVVKKSCNPVWNFSFVYENLTVEELGKRSLELTVWDHDRLISNQLIGGVRFSSSTAAPSETDGSNTNDKETFLWREMMNRPNFWVEGTVKLRSNLNDNKEENNEFCKDD